MLRCKIFYLFSFSTTFWTFPWMLPRRRAEKILVYIYFKLMWMANGVSLLINYKSSLWFFGWLGENIEKV